MKYKNKDGIELSYTGNDVQTKLLKEVIVEALTILEGDRQFPHVTCNKVASFLRENFDIVEVNDLMGGFKENV
jgi:hypothetical protein